MCQECSADFAECNPSPAPSAGLSEVSRREVLESVVVAIEFLNSIVFEDGAGEKRSKVGMEWPLPVADSVLNGLFASRRLLSSKPDPEREAMETIIEDYRRLLDLASDVDAEIMRGYLSALDRVRDRERGM